MTNLNNVNEKQEDIKALERYKQDFKENEVKRREITEQNKNLLAEIIKLQAKILSEK